MNHIASFDLVAAHTPPPPTQNTHASSVRGSLTTSAHTLALTTLPLLLALPLALALALPLAWSDVMMAHRRAARSARRECAGTRRAMGDAA